MFDFIPKKIFNDIQKNNLIFPDRNPEYVARQINQEMLGKSIVLYAAGKHTKELLGFLNNLVKVVAIIDD
ncbi:MAG: hypothetical protein RL154_71, partial [Pseudomonadota bacterium]